MDTKDDLNSTDQDWTSPSETSRLRDELADEDLEDVAGGWSDGSRSDKSRNEGVTEGS